VDLAAGVDHPHLVGEAEPQKAYQLAPSEQSESALAAFAVVALTVPGIVSAASVVAVGWAELVGSVVPVLEVAVLVAVEH